ncbi:DNA topoisomeerase [Dickeya phage Coodle]|uniref:DNA topoisomerase (ATP-hydrolyzing) n=1 Tax=Dickeya phage Coodle TaxID=2320188 RepID=A0A3G2K8V0_9CAUD|nr:DNA topoisomeerase [Dickeya phage Coodle]
MVAKNITVTEFVNTDHKEFSVVNSIRQIPQLIDSLKPSQRKILFAALEYNKEEVVDRLGMFAAARTNYKSGGENMSGTIVNMAQNFPGTNNIPYFDRDGQFGSIMGKSASSARYISVAVSDVIRKIFRKEDEGILEYNYLVDEKLEPKFFLPILPMFLVNGINGIGSGYATDTPCHCVKSVLNALRALLRGEDPTALKPYWNGFKGETGYTEEGRSYSRGLFTRVNATTLNITEVPIGWVSKDYETKVLLPLYKAGTLTEYANDTSEDGWNITVVFKRGELSKLSGQKVEQLFKLYSANKPVWTAWDEDGIIHRYSGWEDMLLPFFNYRLSRYEDRRQYMLKDMTSRMHKLNNRALFIEWATCVDLRQRIDVLKTLFIQDYPDFDGDLDELFRIPLSSITMDARERLLAQIKTLEAQHNELSKKEDIDLYNEDLDDLEKALDLDL